MFVRMKTGRSEGELLDVAPEAARAMLADGRATYAYADQRPPAEPDCEIPADARAALAPIEKPHHGALRKRLRKAVK
jgi:hypothetical protein